MGINFDKLKSLHTEQPLERTKGKRIKHHTVEASPFMF